MADDIKLHKTILLKLIAASMFVLDAKSVTKVSKEGNAGFLQCAQEASIQRCTWCNLTSLEISSGVCLKGTHDIPPH